MSLRAIFLLLLFANLAFFGWATLIDAPTEPPQSDSVANLPQLKLLNEVRGKPSSPDPAPGTGSDTSVPAAQPAGTRAPDPGAAASGASVPSGAAPSGAAPSGAAPSGETAAATSGSRAKGTAPTGIASVAATPLSAAVTGATSAADASRRCVTVGPFGDPERAREATDVLRERGFTPRARTAATRPPQGYWVFIGGLKSSADETNVLHRLESNGISDAKAMPAADAGRRVSVGLFNSLDGAERRARAVQSLGLDAQVEPRTTEEAHWVDVDLNSSSQSLPAEGLLSLEEPGSRLEIKECPAPEVGHGAGSGALTAAGHHPSG